MEKEFIPYLYSYGSVPEIVEAYAFSLLTDKDSRKRALAERLLEYRSTITDTNFLKDIRTWFDDLFELIDKNHPHLTYEMTGRRKSLISTLDKLEEIESTLPPGDYSNKNPFKRVRDFMAFRIILFDQEEPEKCVSQLYQIADEIIDYFTNLKRKIITHDELLGTRGFSAEKHPEIYVPKKSLIRSSHKRLLKDYVSNPKENGYQSLHIVLYDPFTQRYIEIQLRTLSMHVHAESGYASHSVYKVKKYAEQQLLDEPIDWEKVHINGFHYIPETGEIWDYAGVKRSVIVKQRQKTFPHE